MNFTSDRNAARPGRILGHRVNFSVNFLEFLRSISLSFTTLNLGLKSLYQLDLNRWIFSNPAYMLPITPPPPPQKKRLALSHVLCITICYYIMCVKLLQWINGENVRVWCAIVHTCSTCSMMYDACATCCIDFSSVYTCAMMWVYMATEYWLYVGTLSIGQTLASYNLIHNGVPASMFYWHMCVVSTQFATPFTM